MRQPAPSRRPWGAVTVRNASSMSRAASASAAPSRSSASVICWLSLSARIVSMSCATAGSPPDSAMSSGGGPARIVTVPWSATSNPPSRASATRVRTDFRAAAIWSAPSRAAAEARTKVRAASSPAEVMARALSWAASAVVPVQSSRLRRISSDTVSTCVARRRAVSSHSSASRRSESGRHASACETVGRVTWRRIADHCGVRHDRTRRPTCGQRPPSRACWRRRR